MTRLHLDFETYSEVDIKKVTTSVYTSHSSTEALMLGWAVDDDPVQLWMCPEWEMPDRLYQHLVDTRVELHAYNVQFEMGMMPRVLCNWINPRRWHDTMAEAFAMAFPAGLDKVLGAIGLRTKDPEGQKLIQRFCKPAPSNHLVDRYTAKNRPEDWEKFKKYCKQDVEVERELYHWLKKYE